MAEFDYIIVGAGSAGCVLANRLSADPSNQVLLLEAGRPDRSPYIHMAGGVTELVADDKYNWYYWTEPEPGLGGRSLFWPRGKTLGGSSSINAMVYIRGQAADYDSWAAAGCAGWAYRDVLPYFIRSESSERGASAYHGDRGELRVSRNTSTNRFIELFIESAQAAGHPLNDDFNGPGQAGVGPFDFTIHDGRRQSTATAFLRPARQRPNLRIETGAHATQILLDGLRATGVRYQRRGHEQTARARGEVVLAGGAVNSPQLLQLSGIGDPEDFGQFGIPLRHALPGVGRNLQDHLDFSVLFRTRGRQSLLKYMRPHRKGWEGLKWLAHRASIVNDGITPAGGFLDSGAGAGRPDIQLHLLPAFVTDGHGFETISEEGFLIHVCHLHPASRGSIRLRSADPLAAPLISAGYLTAPGDIDALRGGVRLARDIAAQPPLAAEITAEASPGPEAAGDDAALDAAIRARAETIYHPVGTCRMGEDDGAVVDAELRVHGLDGLRVVDASIMPRVISGNTNAPTIMIAEKAADLILGRPAPGPVELPRSAG
jgi:choline dehydrogenase